MATEASAAPISSLFSTATPATASTASSSNQLGANQFLSLLTTQLANQNPLSPMDDTQSVSELAQFSALQATNTLSTNFSTFESNSSLSQAAGLLGQSVTVSTTDASGNASTYTGSVKAVQMVSGAPQFSLTAASGAPIAGSNGVPLEFTLSQIVGVTK